MNSNLENLKSIFNQMEKDGFDILKPLKWGFFFFDDEKEKLLNVFEELKDYNYTNESLEQIEDGKWRLYVTKIEILEMDKLYRRNVAFNELAEYCEIDLYDGWDVEKIDT
jgi:hypothetical protein